MMTFCKIRLGLRQIIIIIIGVAVSIYIVGYVIVAIEDFNPDYKPMRPASSWAPKTDNEFFDPSKNTPESETTK